MSDRTGIRPLVGRAVSTALDLVALRNCGGCGGRGEAGHELCRRCAAQLREALPIGVATAVPIAVATAVPIAVPCFAATRYEGDVRSMLLGYKERGRQGLRADLGAALFVACLAVWLTIPVQQACLPLQLVPIPSRRASVRERGHDGVRGVAAVAARSMRDLSIPAAVAPVLRHAREVADQSGLSIDARAANLAGALEVRRPRPMGGALVIIVDDIVTTGATAAEAVRALSRVGATVAGVAAIAATPRRAPFTMSRRDRFATSRRSNPAASTKSSEQGRMDAVGHQPVRLG